ncbi:extracellular cellulase CelA/allergen Asp F7-like, putative [Talaromyces stipitatus ATCC 10500]|uniref:Extracellular cellulase CelA/allergen Asp F7-like, putative n=1 Tax=Talaromyces stipitatus (strain ATCC 10500 / CBS 375.48 / QM 6759 / NRRL 1006) TaxID=441959 RepID=B8M3S1_TALSN|nr:extracellular cellulase CelA/allergen Asp F7-like, putative [Talaromyces stipitatus ATCC 10500]EED20664.1 extracellular cellulase CelA/allergen Asp F7-like, putative [Talaromyces stipitatus ATCC 10500]
MYYNKFILLPLVLASVCLAGEDTCPADAVPVVVVKTITTTGYFLEPTPTPVVPGDTSVSPVALFPSPSTSASVPVDVIATPESSIAPSSAQSSLTTLVPNSSTLTSIPVDVVATPESSVAPSTIQSSLTTAKQASPTTLIPQLQSSSSSTTSSAAPSSLSSTATATTSSVAATETFVGLGTRYGGDCTEEDCWQSGACSFVDYTLPAGIDGSTCVSQDIWNNGANCGGCISVTYKGKTITVMVTNETGGNATHLDMTPATWSKLTNGYSGGGVDGIEWEWIACPIAQTTPLEIRMHGGASKYWFAATVENARLRTSKLEVSSDSGKTWEAAVLDNYNIWTLSGTLPDNTAWVRVTSVNGDQVIVENVALQSGVTTKAAENY